MNLNDFLFAILIIIYGIQFFADTFVFGYPSKIYSGQKDIGLIFNKQKKLTFLVRISVNLTYPLAAYLVDVSYISTENIIYLLGLMIAAVFGVLCSKPAKPSISGKHVSNRLRLGSWLYVFHFIGIPLSLAVAPIFYEYRATVIQIGIVLNTVSTVAQVWLVDNRLSSLLTDQTLDQLKLEAYYVWLYRTAAKIIGVLIFACVIYIW